MKIVAEMSPPRLEKDHQKLCVEYAHAQGWGHLLICIPNGTWLPGDAKTRARYSAHLKKMGLRPGASDLFLAKPVVRQDQIFLPESWEPPMWHGAWFELKRANASPSAVSAAQAQFLLDMGKQGYYADVCFGFDHWRRSVTNYLQGKSAILVKR